VWIGKVPSTLQFLINFPKNELKLMGELAAEVFMQSLWMCLAAAR